jgi:hypothetical protein
MFSETHLKPHIRFCILNYHFYRTDREGGTAVAVRKGIPHTCVDLLPLLSVTTTGVCIPTGNTEMFVSVVYKSLQKLWCDTNITELLGFRNKSILAGDLNAKHPVWNIKFQAPQA